MSDGADIRDLIPDDSTIRFIHIEEGCTIGEKRNFGCELAQGSLVAHWDDDDYSAADRLADQVSRLEQSRKAVTGYQIMLFTDGASWWRFNYGQDFVLGTSLCYRKEWWQANRFPALQVGEDGAFAATARGCREIDAVDARELMVATIHAGNTSPRTLSHDGWTRLPDFKGVTGYVC